MPASRRSLQVVVLATLLAGCGSGASPGATPTSSGTPSGGSASPTPGASTEAATPSASASPSVVTTPAITAPPVASPSPLGSGGFTTPIPPDPATPWTGIRWTELEPADPLAHVRSVTRWRGGFVATGDLVVAGTSARSKVWISADGGTWEPLEADVFGPSTVVVGVAPVADGVVAFTLQSGHDQYAGEPDRNPSNPWQWTLEEPWQSWTSTDGRTWTAHPGPSFTVSPSTILAGAGSDLVALVLDMRQPLAFTRDGIAWETASLDAFPGGPAGWKATSFVAFAPGFVAVGSAPTGSVAIASADGRAWTSSAIPETCPVGDLTAGPAGLILAGQEGDYHSPTEVWCSSLDGRSWRRLSGYPPLGVSSADDECRGVCPNGILLGDGERMVAYRGGSGQAGWTSFDGRSWRRLTFSGGEPEGWNDWQVRTLLLPIGLMFVNNDGSAWLGTPKT